MTALVSKLVVGVLCALVIVASTGILAATAGGVAVSAGVWVRLALVIAAPSRDPEHARGREAANRRG